MAMIVNSDRQPAYLGTWILPEPSQGADNWNAFSVFRGAQSVLEIYALEAAKIRSGDYSRFVDPAGEVRAALQKFARTLLGARDALYAPLLTNIAARIEQNQRALQAKAANGVDTARALNIVTYLAALPPGDAARKIERAAREGDRFTLAASLSAEPVYSLIPSPQDRERLADALLRATDDVAYGQLIDLRASLEIAQGGWARCQSYIRGDSGLGATEDIGA